MIFKSFLAGFISYVAAIIYNLLNSNNLETVFLSGIKYLFLVPFLALFVQLSIYFIKKQLNNTVANKRKENNINKKESMEKTESTTAAEDFSPLNPPEIEYEEQNDR